MTPIIAHQDKEYLKYIHYKVPLDWIVHNTPSGYMDRDWWIKTMTKLYNVCGVYPVNIQILFFDGHHIHFNDGSLRQMMYKKIQSFVPKEVYSINNQPNDNAPNAKLKSL